MPEVIKFNAGTSKYECDAQQETAECYAQLANMLQNTDKFSGKSGAETFFHMVRDLEDQLNIEHHFSEIVEKQTYTDMIDTIMEKELW